MSKGEELIALARSKAGQWYYTNDWWARMNPDESGGTDCSGFVRWCYLQFGIDVGTWTGDESYAGYEVARGHYPYEIPWDALQPGDLILMTANYWDNYAFNEYLCHIELYCGGGTMIGHPGGYGPQEKWAQAWMESYGCITWMVRRVFEEEIVIPEQKPGTPINNAGLLYRAHVETAGWLDAVHDGQNAGTTGYGARLEAIKITPPDGWELCVKAHIANVGWKTYSGIKKGESSGEGSSANDPIIGSVGESQAIECLIVEVTKRPDGDKRKLKFKVHQANVGWHEWTDESYASGSEGMGVQLEAIRMALV